MSTESRTGGRPPSPDDRLTVTVDQGRDTQALLELLRARGIWFEYRDLLDLSERYADQGVLYIRRRDHDAVVEPYYRACWRRDHGDKPGPLDQMKPPGRHLEPDR